MSDDLVYRIEVFREDDGRYAAEWHTADGTVAGMSNYASTPIGALAELCATLIKVEEDDACERLGIRKARGDAPKDCHDWTGACLHRPDLCLACNEPECKHGPFGFRDHAYRDPHPDRDSK